MHVGDGGEVEIFAPDEGRELLQELFASEDVARDRPRLDIGGALPVLAHAFVIAQRRFERDGDRRRARIGTQPQIGAKHIAVGGALAHDPHDPLRQFDEEIDVLRRLGESRARTVEEHDEIDVGGVVQLEGAALAHAEKNPPGAAFRIALIGEFDLAGERGGAQREANGGGKRGVGDPRQRPRRLRHVPDFGKIGERDDERGVLLREPQQAHQLGFVLAFRCFAFLRSAPRCAARDRSMRMRASRAGSRAERSVR